jgi:DNA repair exonuclease SbcCD ATPase subunit
MKQQMKKTKSSRAKRLSIIAWVVVSAVAFPLLVFPQESQEALRNLAERISEKRARVESLSDEVQQTKTQYNEQLRSLETQITDVETQMNRQELQLDQLEQDLQEARQRVEQSDELSEEIRPLVSQVLTRLKQYTRQGLPFQVSERVSAIEELEQTLADGNVPASTVLTRTWNMLDSEFRMTEESGIFRQRITVNGERQLAEVARLGTVLLYFRTFNDQYGYAVPQGEGEWSYELAQGREETTRISALFDALDRNLREGYFPIPNPYENEG